MVHRGSKSRGRAFSYPLAWNQCPDLFFFFRAKPSPMLLILRLKDIFLIKLSIMCVLDDFETPVSYAAIESAFWRPPMIHWAPPLLCFPFFHCQCIYYMPVALCLLSGVVCALSFMLFCYLFVPSFLSLVTRLHNCSQQTASIPEPGGVFLLKWSFFVSTTACP